MSVYDPKQLYMVAIRQSSRLPLRLGVSVLGTSAGSARFIETSSITISGGYTVEDQGVLTIDPITASGSLAVVGTGTPTAATPQLAPGNYVGVLYGPALLFTGVVDTIDVTLEAIAERPGFWERRVTYTLLSASAILLGRTVSWSEILPAEGALRRLQRWFDVDYFNLPPAHRALLFEPMGALEPGSMTLLDAMRAFSARTMLPLVGLEDGTLHVRVVDWSQTWDGVAPAPTAGELTATAADWAHEAGYATVPLTSSLLITGPEPVADEPFIMAAEGRDEYGTQQFRYGANVWARGRALISEPVRHVRANGVGDRVDRTIVSAVVGTFSPDDDRYRIFLFGRLGPFPLGTPQGTQMSDSVLYWTKFSMNHAAIAARFPTLRRYRVSFKWKPFSYTAAVERGGGYTKADDAYWENIYLRIGGTPVLLDDGEYVTGWTSVADPDRLLDVDWADWIPGNRGSQQPLAPAGDIGVIFTEITFIPEVPPGPNVLRINARSPFPTDTAAELTLDAPHGTQHVENFTKMFSLEVPRFQATSATIATDNAVLLDANLRSPDVVGTVTGQTAAVSRVEHTFTPKHYTSSMEMAPPVNLRSSPFDQSPYVISNGGGSVQIGYSVTAAAAAKYRGEVLWLLSTGRYVYDHPTDVAWLGHQIPATAEGLLWHPALAGGGTASRGASFMYGAKTGEVQPLIVGQRYFLSVYLTTIQARVLPTTPGATLNYLSYPSPTLAWVQE